MGPPYARATIAKERIGPLTGLPIFELDALSSAAYGPEAALTLLIPLGAAGIAYILPISIVILLVKGNQRISTMNIPWYLKN